MDKLKILGSKLCKNTQETIAFCTENHIEFEMIDIMESLDNLKIFLKIRESRPDLYDEARQNDKIGLPCIILPDGTVTRNKNDIISPFVITREGTEDGGTYRVKTNDGISAGYLSYRYSYRGNMIAEHTKVESDFSRKGIGQKLADRLIADARKEKRKIEPVCTFVKHYLEKHAAVVKDIWQPEKEETVAEEAEESIEQIRSSIEEAIHRLYDNSPFIHLCGIELVSVKCGEIIMKMKTKPDIHVNTHGVVHAGAFVTLADTAFGAVCITKGRRSVTTGLSFNIVGNIKAGETAIAVVKTGHIGRTVGSATVDIHSEKGRLLCQGLGNLHMTEVLENIPFAW